MSSPDLDLVVIGDCNPDVLVLGSDVSPVFGQAEKLVSRMSLEIGGSASITAVAAARLGLRVALVAAVGRDAAGTFMLDALTREGVDVSAVAIRDGLATGMTVALSRGGDRAILTALGAMDSLTASDVPASVFARARHVHVSSYFLLADSLGPGLASLFADARAAGAATSLDTNWDPAERWRDERLSAAIAQADLLLPNEAEALALSGTSSVPAAAVALAALGPRVAVKLGARGVLVASGSAELRQVSLPPVTPVDTTGAGDCFNAGLIAGLLHGLPLPRAAAFGCATGALSTGALGGTAGAPGLQKATDLAAHAVIALPTCAQVGKSKGTTFQASGRLNSPLRAPSRKARHSVWVNDRTAPERSRECRIRTASTPSATSRQLPPGWDAVLLRHTSSSDAALVTLPPRGSRCRGSGAASIEPRPSETTPTEYDEGQL